MPVFAFHPDPMRNHHMVDDLGRNDLSTRSSRFSITEPRSGHLGVDVLVDAVDVLIGKFVVNLRRDIGGHRHTPNVPQRLFGSLLRRAHERLFEERLPF